ncbi:MAG: fructosamine kinase family protein [Treponema sp.]|uniref:fructosamine kinase family protein n=1 Tax=Treponema sp. TaxID=166 RepID=UPI0025F724DF|nr:fructosamine kinase family protein [Treponema sp.]MBQ8679338.1 fructosamine kinase family protein [Treponema sp.]
MCGSGGKAWLIDPAGYEERRDLYNLYHNLNHLIMFGSGYLGAVKSILEEYVG